MYQNTKIIKKILFVFFGMLTFFLCACNAESPSQPLEIQLPSPSELFYEIENTVSLHEMIDLPHDLFFDYYGINPEWFYDAAAYTCVDIMFPDEIIIVRAKGQNEANLVREMLDSHIDFKIRSAANYFVETVPVIENGIIRQDGLTVSLIVSDELQAILAIFDSYS